MENDDIKRKLVESGSMENRIDNLELALRALADFLFDSLPPDKREQIRQALGDQQ